MSKIKKRLLDLHLPAHKSAFLWGPRKSGKSYWLHHNLKNIILIDLLKTDVFSEYASRPSLIRERYQNEKRIIVIDEVQKIPDILNEVHWLIENKNISFLLTGSSARKLKRGHSNLLGGRAWRRNMMPLSYLETTDFNLEHIMISGLLPPHFLSQYPREELRAYIADYLKEEIASEALVQNLPTFSEFLKVAALTSSELINYVNVARETGVSHKVVRNYFDILEDTYLGFRIPPWTRSKNRRMIATEKFYLFDVGVTNYLAGREPKQGTSEFGKSFEQYILMEIKAYQAYKNPELSISYWRTSTGQEVDFILGEKNIALEIKASSRVHEGDERFLKALQEDGPVKNSLIVSLEKEPRQMSKNITVIPWNLFIENLWEGIYFS